METIIFNLLMLGLVVAILWRLIKPRQTYSDAYGGAFWADDKMLKAWGMLTKGGLLLGRTLSGKLFYVHDFVHLMVIGGTGSGKSQGLVATNLDQSPIAAIAFDPKGELATISPGITIASDNSAHRANPMQLIMPGNVDAARELAREIIDVDEKVTDSHWNESAAECVAAGICLVSMKAMPEKRNLRAVAGLLGSPEAMAALAKGLNAEGGVYSNMAGKIDGLFDNGKLSREGLSVFSTIGRHIAWINGVAGDTVCETTFDLLRMRDPGSRIYLRTPIEMLSAHKGWLRVMSGTLMRVAQQTKGGELLCLFDEAWILNGLPSLKKILLLGRSGGIRLMLAYQSLSQATSAFKDEPTLVQDNTNTHVYLQIGNIDDAKKLSEILGKRTIEVWNSSTNHGSSTGTAQPGTTFSHGGGAQATKLGKDLASPDELMRLTSDSQIIDHRGFPAPIFARKVLWFLDPAFGGKQQRPRQDGLPWRKRIPLLWRVVIGVGIWLGVMLSLKAYKDARYTTVNTWQKK